MKDNNESYLAVLNFYILFLLLATVQISNAEEFNLPDRIWVENGSVRIAAFDADNTLRRSLGDKAYPTDASEQILLEGVAEKIRALNEAGYLVAIFSNQTSALFPKQIENRKEIFKDLIKNLETKGAKVDYFDFADFYEYTSIKPRAGMWQKLVRELSKHGLTVDKYASFMVGDSGYTIEDLETGSHKKPDHSNHDRQFAKNIGISFFSAQSFFKKDSNADLVSQEQSLLFAKLQIEIAKSFEEISRVEFEIDNFNLNSASLLDSANDPGILAFNQKIDHLNNLQHKWFLRLSQSTSELLKFSIKSRSTEKEFESHAKLFNELNEKANVFNSYSEYYGTQNDYRRYNAFIDYLSNFNRVIDHAKVFSKITNIKSTLSGFSMDLKQLLILGKVGLMTMGPSLKFAYSILFQLKSPNGQTPITKAALDFFGNWAKGSGLELSIEGLENIPLTKSGEVNIFLPNHVDPSLDLALASQLGLKNLLTVGALNIKGNRFFGFAVSEKWQPFLRQFTRNDHFFIVGQGHSIIDDLTDALVSEKSRNFLFYSQGITSLGFNETNPVRNGLGKLIRHLRQAGLKVNLVPVVMPDQELLLKYQKSLILKTDSGNSIRAKVLPTISDQDLSELENQNRLPILGPWLRQLWVSELHTDSERVIGIKRWHLILDELRARQWIPQLSIKNKCSQIFIGNDL